MLIRTRRRTFSNSYKFVRGMINNRYIIEEYDKFTNYKIEIKNTFKINSRNSAVRIMSNNKLFSHKITDYKRSNICRRHKCQ